MKRVIEIRAAEGGEDSKLFMTDLAQAYQRHFSRVGWLNRIIRELPGEIYIEVSGSDLTNLEKESGGHRIQRVPPTERKGRVHTSTVTVAVIDPVTQEKEYTDADFRVEWYSGTGAGGQNRNKVLNSCRITHISTGTISTAQTRSRVNSLTLAKSDLISKLKFNDEIKLNQEISIKRKKQVGSGMRSDKIRTYRYQDDIVTDHSTGIKLSVKKVMSGYFDLFW